MTWARHLFHEPERTGICAIVVLHSVGLAGMLSPYRDVFIALTPLNLMLSAAVVMRAEAKRLGSGLWLWAAVVAAAGWAAEYAGAVHGLLFGNYTYGAVLGPGLSGVPVIIGINWVLMMAGAGAWAALLPWPVWMRAVCGAALATAVDWVMEPVAVSIGLWQWEGGAIPLGNYVTWFLLSFLFLAARERCCGKDGSRAARCWLVIVAVFFGALRVAG